MTDRKQLQRQLAECNAAEERYQCLQRQIIEAGRRIDEAVEAHQKKAAEIHQHPNMPDLAALDEANAKLDAICSAERARIKQLQSEAMSAAWQANSGGAIETQLIQSASGELQNEKWRLDQEKVWLDARRTAARKSLAAAEVALRAATDSAKAERQVEVDRWRVEFAQADAALTAIEVEREELRQRMLRE